MTTGRASALKPVQKLFAKILEALAAIRPSERRETLGAFLTLFGFMAGHALLETARDALFLAELPVSLLPWVYLTLAVAALLMTRYRTRLSRYFRSGQELKGWLISAGTVTLALWSMIFWAGDWIFYVLYAWSGLIATLIVVQFWAMLSDRLTVTQAKRLFAVIGTGSVLGAILGSGLATVLTEYLAAQHLVAFAGALFLATSFAPLLLGAAASRPLVKQAHPDFTAVDIKRLSKLVWRRPYLRRLATAILLATVTFTLVDFVFKSTVARLVADEQLGEFFASVYFTLNIASLLVQIVAVRWLLQRVSVSVALAIVPALLLIGTLGFMAVTGLVTVVLLKGIDGSLRYSLYRTTTELLYVPMSADIRGPVKVFIDVLGQRGGQAIGALLVLLVLSLTPRETGVALLAAMTAAGWLYLLVHLRPHYLELFRATLREDITATKIDFPALDLASLEILLATLNSADDRKVIAALDLLAAQGRMRVVPGLILYHPSAQVVMHALELFAAAGRDDVLPLIDRLLADPGEDLRTASLRVRATLASEESLLRAGLLDASPAVRVTAAVGLVAAGWMPLEDAQPEFSMAFDRGEASTLRSLARAIKALPDPRFRRLLLALADCEDDVVRLSAIRAMRAQADPAFIPVLMQLLTHRVLRAEARGTLVTLGPAALSGVAEALADKSRAHAVRRHLPHVVAAFGTPQASKILLQQLLDEPDGMIRFKLLRGLGRLRRVNPQLPLDRSMLSRSIEQNLRAGFRFMRWRHALEDSTRSVPPALAEHHSILLELLKDKQAHTLERLFRLLNLRANDEEFLRIYRGFRSSRREAQAGSRELIEHTVEPPLRQSVLALADDLYDPGGLETDHRRDPRLGFDEALGELIDCHTESLSSLAAYEAGAMRIEGLLPRLVAAKRYSASHAAIFEEAISALSPGVEYQVPHG